MKTVVIMATFNGASFIIEQLESIRCQSSPVDAVYVADDGSTDGTVTIVQDWIERHHLEGSWDIRVNSKNLGYAGNFINLISKAVHEGSDFIFLADQDDIWLPEKVKQMTGLMKQYPTMGLLCSDLTPFYASSNASRYHLATLKSGNRPFLRFCAQWIWALRPGCTFVLSSEFAQTAVALWKPIFAHDTYLWALAHLKRAVGYYPADTMKYRRHESNNSGDTSKLRKESRINDLRDVIMEIDYLLDLANDKDTRFIKEQKAFFQRRLDCLSHGRTALPRLCFDGLFHLKYYVRKRHFLSDLYVCIK